MFSWQRDVLVTALCCAGLPRLNASPIDSLALVLASRAVIKCGGPGAGGPPPANIKLPPPPPPTPQPKFQRKIEGKKNQKKSLAV